MHENKKIAKWIMVVAFGEVGNEISKDMQGTTNESVIFWFLKIEKNPNATIYYLILH